MAVNLGVWEENEITVLRQMLDRALRHSGLEVAQNVVVLDAKIMAAVNAPKATIGEAGQKFVGRIIGGGADGEAA